MELKDIKVNEYYQAGDTHIRCQVIRIEGEKVHVSTYQGCFTCKAEDLTELPEPAGKGK